ncbi:MAG: hypothetical protein HY645_13850 [Acidobacteria bacterium]|nr:hypothetical protein [Acidobacteriota bacterium]
MNAELLIVRRLLQEVESADRLILGPGIPTLVRAHLKPDVEIWTLESDGAIHGVADLAVVEAIEVSGAGDLSLDPSRPGTLPRARRWVVATRHTRTDGEPKIVRCCRLPVHCPHCVNLIITELGVIEVTSTGLVLKEVAAGIATDEVKAKTAASLHVADDIRLMSV